MHPLHQPIRLGVVGGGPIQLDAERVGHVGPQSRRTLGASVGGYHPGNAETGDPIIHQGGAQRWCRDVGNRDGFQPPSETVDNCQEIRASMGRGQRSDEIQVTVLKAGGGHRDKLCRRADMADNLRFLCFFEGRGLACDVTSLAVAHNRTLPRP